MGVPPTTIRRCDYRPPDFAVPEVVLDFELHPTATRVRSELTVERRTPDAPLRLDGEDLDLISLTVDGTPAAYAEDGNGIVVEGVPDRAAVAAEVVINPAGNTRLEGLYRSEGRYCTQCEAEGFRRITYFPDRPDVMSRHRVTIRADKADAPVLLSNGNRTAHRDLGVRHEAVWEDPWPKPSYLFALVAGQLGALEDRFVTRSGREVALAIHVAPGDEPRAAYAMDALKRAMRWDEEAYGFEYDLDLFNIVAVADFNMGAMENKSLNIFNSKLILADPQTATDQDHAFIERVVAHEYFHNWTGNRITCRDWFQLSLKEGLTVFRDQQFMADMRSPPVQRIAEVRTLRARQFPEDAGPLAHPIRPDQYIEINNFYTPTVYEKGAEVVRMCRTLLGAEGYRKGIDLYVARHDGQAVTCDDFLAAMADANGRDMGRFALWYSQAGTPQLRVAGEARADGYALVIEQHTPPTPGQPDKEPLPIPFDYALLDAGGTAMAADRIVLRDARTEIPHRGLAGPFALSLNRGFGAPVRLEVERSDAERAFLMVHDGDAFARWEAGQEYGLAVLNRMTADSGLAPDAVFVDALGSALDACADDPAFAAEMLTLPSPDTIAEGMAEIDVDGIDRSHRALSAAVGTRLGERLRDLYHGLTANEPYSPDAAPAGRRALRNRALGHLAAAGEAGVALAGAQALAADNMTDRMAALQALADTDGPERDAGLSAFEERFGSDANAMDKWFHLQAISALPDAIGRLRRLMAHPSFSIRNPNKVRAVLGGFSLANPTRFHAADGSGYAFLADRILELDGINPQVGARLLTALGRWRRFGEPRRALMRAELERILGRRGLSPDIYEIASRSLA